MKLDKIAQIVGGELVGDPEAEVDSIAPVSSAGEGVLTFAASEQYLDEAADSKATCVIVPRGLQVDGKNLIVVDDPRLALALALEVIYEEERVDPGIQAGALVAETARVAASSHIGASAHICEDVEIGEKTAIHPFVYVGRGVKIGSDCVIHPHVTIYPGVVLGNRVIVHANTVLGSDGFGYAADGGCHRKIRQVGSVFVEDDVEIGANAAIDRATLGETRIKKGTKIDNLVHIAHNVVIGTDCLIVAQVGIAGSTEIGENVTIAGQAGLVHHIKIGSGSFIGAQSGVTRSFPDKSTISGYPARDHKRTMKGYAAVARLPLLLEELKKINERLERLEKTVGKT